MRTREEERELDRKYTKGMLEKARQLLKEYKQAKESIEKAIENKEEFIDELILNCDHKFEKEYCKGKAIYRHCTVCDSTVFRGFKDEKDNYI